MVKEHVPGAYKAFKNHGKVDFGMKPDDYDNTNRHYKTWHQTKGGNYYQGLDTEVLDEWFTRQQFTRPWHRPR